MSSIGNIFQRFKQDKQLPVLFLTLAGIVAVLFSFGYLLKYYVADYIDTISNGVILILVLSFLFSFAFFITGLLLYTKENFKGVASALVSLSVLLNYLLIYFLSLIGSSVENIFAEYAGTVLIFVNTIVAITVTIANKDKILSLLCIVGGALTPLFFEALSFGAPMYFGYLFLLSASSLYVSNVLKWNFLAVVTFTLTTIILEYFVLSLDGLFFFDSINVAIYHAFAYMYVFYFLFNSNTKTPISDDGSHDKTIASLPLNFQHIPLMIINVSFLFLNLFFYYGTQDKFNILRIFYLLNTVPFIIFFLLYLKKDNRSMQMLMLALIAFLLMLSVGIFSPANLMGVFWVVEAMVFVYIGYTSKLGNVRKIGYFFVVIASIAVFIEIRHVFINWDTIFSEGYFNLLAIGIMLSFLIYFSKKHSPSDKREDKLLGVLYEIYSVWLAFFCFITLRYFTFEWITIFFVIPSFYLFYRAKRKDLKLTRYIAFGIYLYIIFNAIYWAITDNMLGKEGYFASYGFWNIVAIGVLLKILQLWKEKLLTVKKKIIATDHKKPNTYLGDKLARISIIRIIDVLFYWWILVVFAVFFGHFNPNSIVYVLTAPVLLLFYKSYTDKMPLLRFSGIIVLSAIIFILLRVSFHEFKENWGATLYHLGTFNLIWTTVIIVVFKLLFIYALKLKDDHAGQLNILKYNKFFTEVLTAFVVLLGAIITYHEITAVYVYHLAAFPMFAIIYYGDKRKLPLTEMIGMAHYIFMAVGIILMYDFGKSPIRQEIHLVLLIVESYLLMFPLKYFYGKFMADNKRQELVDRLNVIFFFVMPAGFVFVAGNLFKEHLGYVLWGAFFLNFLCAEFSRKGAVYYQIYFWLILALFNTVYEGDYHFLLAGIAVLWAIVIFKKGIFRRISYHKKIENKNTLRYRFIPEVAFYFTAYLIYSSYLRLLPGDTVGAYLSATLFLLLLTYKKNKFFAIRTSYRIAYRTAAVLLPISLLLLLSSHNIIAFVSYSNSSRWAELLLLPASLTILTILLYKRKIIYVTDKNIVIWKMDMYLLHLCFMGTYVFFLSYFKIELYKMTITTLWFLHATVLLLYIVRPKLKFLVKLSYIIFIVAMYKLFINDFKDMEMYRRIIILLVIGMMFLGASFVFVKWKERSEKKK